jgi:hypothetical protein
MDRNGIGEQAERASDGMDAPGALSPAGPPAASYPRESHLLVNLTVERRFDYRFLYRLVSLALRNGGRLERCNGETARFSFPHGSIAEFIGEIGNRAPVGRTLVCPRDSGGSWINVRFRS